MSSNKLICHNPKCRSEMGVGDINNIISEHDAKHSYITLSIICPVCFSYNRMKTVLISVNAVVFNVITKLKGEY